MSCHYVPARTSHRSRKELITSGTFLTAFTPFLNKSSSSLFPICSIRTQSEKYLSASTSGDKTELRADAEVVDEKERVYIKCQREFVYKAKLAAAEARGETSGSKKRVFDNGPDAGSIEDEIAKKCVTHQLIYLEGS
jgi:protein FRG1